MSKTMMQIMLKNSGPTPSDSLQILITHSDMPSIQDISARCLQTIGQYRMFMFILLAVC